MSTKTDSHWSASSNHIRVGIFPATFFIPIPVLPFFHPIWFVLLSIVWMSLTFWLSTKGLGINGIPIIFRRWLQGNTLHTKPKITKRP